MLTFILKTHSIVSQGFLIFWSTVSFVAVTALLFGVESDRLRFGVANDAGVH